MEVRCQVIRPKDARQYRQRSISVLPRVDTAQSSTTSGHVEDQETSAARSRPEMTLSPNAHERLAAAKRAQDELNDRVRAEVLVMRERQYEELRTVRQLRESAAREKREREELLHQQRMNEIEQMMLERETGRIMEEEERNAEVSRTEAIRDAMREYMIRYTESKKDRRLAQYLETRAIVAEARLQAQKDIGEAQLQAQKDAEERERIRRERLRECAVCMEEDDMSSMIQAPCEHWFCLEDLHNAFLNALDSRRPFRCCQQEIPVDLSPTLSENFQERYRLMMLELTTPNPVYCSNRACGIFLPPAWYRGPDVAACRTCGYTTCRMCRNAAHDGVCQQDVGIQQVISLATRSGWRSCPTCNNMVERRSGCDHMTCICGGEFCYVCGSVWGHCREHHY
ncbi:hypothetical protein F4680DRAFT_390847 [Xylaria scruposa]|nr:hypothetical protein F4680DRAFT_390847 [Xylaria scruposa]